MNPARDDFKSLVKYIVVYNSSKTKRAVLYFEKAKNSSVEVLMHRRGRFQKHVWHTSMIGLASVGFLSSGVIGGDSIVASSFPGVGGVDPRVIQTYDPNTESGSFDGLISFKTSESDKPRSEIIEYEVKSGETVSEIAQKFGIDTDTIAWANDLDSVSNVKPGDSLKILPVSGVAYTVKSGDTLDSIAKKYSAESQAILSFPFNDISDDLSLKKGDTLIIPDGVPPESKVPPKPKIQPKSNIQGPSSPSYSAPAGGSFIWPATFSYISTYFAWWHPGIDLPNPSAPPIQAADGGVVTVAGWPDNYGYGNRIIVDHGNGYQTLYAHLSNIYVTAGQTVGKGQVIGQMGSTGRSTGTHLHFEIRYKGVAVNPLAILK